MSGATEVLVVGAGPVGVVLTRLLGELGILTTLIDREPDVLRVPRAIALDDDGGRVLQAIGDYTQLRKGMPRIERVRLVSTNAGEVLSIDANCWRNGNPMILMFRQPELEDTLRAGLERLPSVSFRTGAELASAREDSAGVTVQLSDRTEIRSRFVVGCDGAHSSVRRVLGIDLLGDTYTHDWLVIDALCDPRPDREVCFIGDPVRPAVTMPAPNGGRRWEFMLAPGDDRARIAAPESLARLLAPWGDVAQMQIERAAVYTFHARVASRMQLGRFFLAGDAAHLTPPFAGQGLMSGLRDAQNLAWKLAAVVRGAAPALLDSYSAERLPHVREMVRLAQHMGGLIMAKRGPRSVFRDAVLRPIARLPVVRRKVATLRSKPCTRIDCGWIGKRKRVGALRSGDLLPQCSVRAGRTMLLDERIGYRWALVGLGVRPSEWLRRDQQASWARLGAHVTIAPDAEEDVDGALTDAIPQGHVVIARPDRHIFDICLAGKLEQAVDAVLARLSSART
jgi:3-(3-hydroxy-phenyl)propionate hydroxylase